MSGKSWSRSDSMEIPAPPTAANEPPIPAVMPAGITAGGISRPPIENMITRIADSQGATFANILAGSVGIKLDSNEGIWFVKSNCPVVTPV